MTVRAEDCNWGSVLVCVSNNDFGCVHKGTIYKVCVDADGPYVECGQGRHEIKTAYNRKFFELADGPW